MGRAGSLDHPLERATVVARRDGADPLRILALVDQQHAGFAGQPRGRMKFRPPVAASYCVTGEHAFHQLGNGRCGARSTVLLECRIERLHECIRSGVGDRYNEP
ncbi:hypothetical protein X948_2887 [Burkholderia pseudomallei MSHR5608]|nr:hypothetical protein X948_2887 [Burkholderia pseudomallei MSHR5608]